MQWWNERLRIVSEQLEQLIVTLDKTSTTNTTTKELHQGDVEKPDEEKAAFNLLFGVGFAKFFSKLPR